MSHFTVMVALPADTADVGDALNELLEKWNENRQVDPYRSYIEGNAADHYITKMLVENGHLKAEDPSWRDVFDARYEHWKKDKAYYGHDSFDWHWDEELHVPYELCSYNPDSKWDWWSIGGRWTGYFPIKGDAMRDPSDLDRLIGGTPGAFGNQAEPGWLDGGPRKFLDLERLRADKQRKAEEEWDLFRVLKGDLEGHGWSHFRGLIDTEVDGAVYTVEQARVDYREQPLMKRIQGDTHFGRFWDDPIDNFAMSREAYAKQARDSAVPTFAYIDLKGEWRAPGDMGWFGMSTDDEGGRLLFREQMNEEIDKLDEDTILVVLDFHI